MKNNKGEGRGGFLPLKRGGGLIREEGGGLFEREGFIEDLW